MVPSCCPDCGGDLRVVGEDVSELLDMIAAQMKVIQIAWIKKSCRRCEKMVQDPAPSRPIPDSMAGPNLLDRRTCSNRHQSRRARAVPDWNRTKKLALRGADTGAETLSRAMTIIETAKLNSLGPQAYLADVLDRIHDHRINRLDELLP